MAYKAPRSRPAYDWTGIYFGTDGGLGRATANGTLTDTAGASLTGTATTKRPGCRIVRGRQLSIRQIRAWRRRRLAVVQPDRQQQTLAPLGAAGAFPGGPFTISTTVKDYGSVRGRLGYAVDRFLVFGTGGWAWGNPLTSYALTGAAPFVNNSGSSTGWTAGLGVEYAFTNNISGRLEYRYTSVGTS